MPEPLAESQQHDSLGRQLVRSRFRSFYARSQPYPAELVRREFGFGFTKKIDYRHKSFSSRNDFTDYLLLEIPFFVSYSTALYEKPSATPMNRKGYLGADLVFDLDTSYEKDGEHEHNPILCPHCLERVKEDCIRLAEDFLLNDFGVSENELTINYSGSKGYHLHVQNQAVRQLSAEARKQLLSYITATELDLTRFLRKEQFGQRKDDYVIRGPSWQARGWAKKLFTTAHSFIEKAEAKEFKEEHISSQRAKKITENRAIILNKMNEGNWDALRGMDSVWEKLLRKAVVLQSLEVDKAVTYDLHRLIRLEDSLHGDTGFVAKKIPLNQLHDFKPHEHALAFDEKQTHWIKSNVTGTLEIQGQKIELTEGKLIEVPENAAIYLLCKQKAELK
ncbi:hypothetical protein AUJ65_01280 [Candidatus Micrarchaeota archaeon CG1_02_51_15]|nr:MAG: hypothetical protein AUJ65_01280 [Candidatus Micrarchaeota archaeon CG1_02_51_15]